MTRRLDEAKKRYDDAEAILEEAIFREIEIVALRNGIDHMVFTHMCDSYYIGDEAVECEKIDDLVEMYCECVHHGGFEQPWSVEKGWH